MSARWPCTVPARVALAAVAALSWLALDIGSACADPVRGAGSTFVAPLIERWQRGFRIEQTDGADQLSVDLGVDYEPVGSLAGVMRATQVGMDFGATDRPVPPEDLARLGLGQFPIVAGGIAIVVNLAGIGGGELKLTGPVIADIYLGRIKAWNDAAIQALNPSLRLPEAPIAVIHRSDGSGTTYNLAEFLSRKSARWRAELGADTLLDWPVGQGVAKNEGVARAVQTTPNSIGYVEAGLGMRFGLTDASVQNQSGAFVSPSLDTLSAAVANARWSEAGDFDLVLNDAPGANTYPILATVFAVMPKQARTPSRRATLQFFRFALERGGQDAVDLGFVPAPPALVRQVQDYWASDLVGAGG